jgi:EmrB/QacA subfamily drug resistance transporter
MDHETQAGGRSGPAGLVLVALGIFLAALDQTVIVTALPGGMLSDLSISDQELDRGLWIITGYLLGYTVAMPLLGRIADVYGLRRVFIAALLLFGVASAGCALAESLEVLVGWRVVQAIGGGAVLPIGMAIAIDQARGNGATALGFIGAAAEAGGVLGPAWGGLIASHPDLGWRWIFWVNLPLAALLAAGVYLTLRASRPERGQVDYVGGGLLAGALTGLTIALSRSVGSAVAGVDPVETERYAVSWTAPGTLLLLGGALVAFLAFLWWERRFSHPLIELSSFRRPAFAGANATNFLVGVALIVAMVNIPFLENSVRGGDAFSGGLLLMRLTVMIPVGAALGGLAMRRVAGRIVTIVGLLISATGFWLLGGWGVDVANLQATLDLLLTGLGFGLVIAPLGAAAIGSVGRDRMTTAAALLTVLRLVGMTIGIAVLASWSLAQKNVLSQEISRNFDFLTQSEEMGQAMYSALL